MKVTVYMAIKPCFLDLKFGRFVKLCFFLELWQNLCTSRPLGAPTTPPIEKLLKIGRQTRVIFSGPSF